MSALACSPSSSLRCVPSPRLWTILWRQQFPPSPELQLNRSSAGRAFCRGEVPPDCRRDRRDLPPQERRQHPPGHPERRSGNPPRLSALNLCSSTRHSAHPNSCVLFTSPPPQRPHAALNVRALGAAVRARRRQHRADRRGPRHFERADRGAGRVGSALPRARCAALHWRQGARRDPGRRAGRPLWPRQASGLI